MYALFVREPNARIHLALTFLAIAGGWYFQISSYEWLAIIGCVGLVMAAESFNTAIEEILDLLHPDKHDRVALAKDLAAGGVLWTALAALLVACFIFVPKIIILFN